MPSDSFRKLMQLQTSAEFASEEDPYLSARLNYEAECQKYGIDPRLGLLDPLAYALEVVSRMEPDDQGPKRR